MSTISGIISDAVALTPIDGCRVILSGATTTLTLISENTLTDNDGSYQFLNIPNGTYFFRVYKDGYDDHGNLFTISSPNTYTRNISLNPKHVVISSPKYFCQFSDIEESKVYRIELHKYDYTGSSTQIHKMSDTPAVLSYRKSTKGEQEIIQSSELRFSLVVPKSDIAIYEDIFQSEYKDWRVELYVDDVLDWIGYLQPDAVDRSVFDQEITINMTASDALKDLKEYQFDAEGKISIIQAIRDAISPIGIHLPFRVKYGIRETTQESSVLSWITQKINTIAFATDQHIVDSVSGLRRPRAITPTVHYKLDNCYSVLEKILSGCRCVLRQINGKYVIQNVHEGDTFYYELPWSDVTSATRVAANDIVSMSNKKYHINSTFSNIVPIKELHITHYNRNLGESLANFNNYNNWTYENWSDVVIDNNRVNLIWTFEDELGRLTYNDPIYLSPITDRDYIQISLSSAYYLSNPNVSLSALFFNIWVTKPDGVTYIDQQNVHWPDKQTSSERNLLITGPSEALKIDQEGNYSISINFYWSAFPHPYVGVCTVKNIEIKQVVMAGEDKLDSDVTFDTNYIASISRGKIVESHDIYFADSPRATDLGSILIDNGSTLTPSLLWSRDYAEGEMPFVSLYALQYLSDRCRYKDYISLTVFDPDIDILPSSWVVFSRDGSSRIYRILGHTRDLQGNNLTLTLEQVLSDDVSVNINQVQLPSVSGEGGKNSSSVLPPAPVGYTHPLGFTSQPESPLSAASVISQIIVNEQGHLTGIETRNLTATDIGALSNTLSSGQILIGSSGNVATARNLSLNATPGTFNLSSLGGLTMPNASGTVRGLLSAANWTTFNSKQSALSNSTSVILSSNTLQRAALSGDVSASQNSNTVTVTGIRNKSITLATGYLFYTGTAWEFKNETYLTSVTAHNLLSTIHGDTLAGEVERGDLLIGNNTPKWSKLAKGTEGQVLTSDGTDIAWQDPSGSNWTLRTSTPKAIYRSEGIESFVFGEAPDSTFGFGDALRGMRVKGNYGGTSPGLYAFEVNHGDNTALLKVDYTGVVMPRLSEKIEYYDRVVVANTSGYLGYVDKSSLGGGGSDLEIQAEGSNTFSVSLSAPKLHTRTLTGNASITVSVGSSTISKTTIIILTSTASRTVSWTGTGIKWQDDVPLANVVADWTYVITLANKGNNLSDVLISFVRLK